MEQNTGLINSWFKNLCVLNLLFTHFHIFCPTILQFPSYYYSPLETKYSGTPQINNTHWAIYYIIYETGPLCIAGREQIISRSPATAN